jgi:hypothetical protein
MSLQNKYLKYKNKLKQFGGTKKIKYSEELIKFTNFICNDEISKINLMQSVYSSTYILIGIEAGNPCSNEKYSLCNVIFQFRFPCFSSSNIAHIGNVKFIKDIMNDNLVICFASNKPFFVIILLKKCLIFLYIYMKSYNILIIYIILNLFI